MDGTMHHLAFRKSRPGDGAWINGGFSYSRLRVIDYIDGDETVWEREPLEQLARDDRN
jgi:glucose-1-phosphate cytidylyltransferase